MNYMIKKLWGNLELGGGKYAQIPSPSLSHNGECLMNEPWQLTTV